MPVPTSKNMAGPAEAANASRTPAAPSLSDVKRMGWGDLTLLEEAQDTLDVIDEDSDTEWLSDAEEPIQKADETATKVVHIIYPHCQRCSVLNVPGD